MFPSIQRKPLGRTGGPVKTHTVEPGDSLSGIAGYPGDGWQERLDQLIAANPDYPSIKNLTPDDPKYGWLEVGDEINVPIALAPVIDPGEGHVSRLPERLGIDRQHRPWPSIGHARYRYCKTGDV